MWQRPAAALGPRQSGCAAAGCRCARAAAAIGAAARAGLSAKRIASAAALPISGMAAGRQPKGSLAAAATAPRSVPTSLGSQSTKGSKGSSCAVPTSLGLQSKGSKGSSCAVPSIAYGNGTDGTKRVYASGCGMRGHLACASGRTGSVRGVWGYCGRGFAKAPKRLSHSLSPQPQPTGGRERSALKRNHSVRKSHAQPPAH